MLFSSDFKIGDDHLIVQVHLPRTAGTSLRRLLNKVLGQDKCLNNYNGEIEQLSGEQLASYQLVSGHFPYGIHQHFTKLPVYVSTVRHPIERYLSTYAEFLTNPNSKHHAAARQYDVNAFLRHGLASDDPSLRNQFNNLQCRHLCGQSDFATARQFVDHKYFLVCTQGDVGPMADMLLAALGAQSAEVPQFHVSREKMTPALAHGTLSLDSVALLLACEQEDLLLYNYVEQAFRIARAGAAASAPASAALAASTEVIPPKALRFMGEADSRFLHMAECVADVVLDLHGKPGPENMLDIGCGYGRLAYGLRRGEYAGRYTGFDILSRQIAWLNDNFHVPGKPGSYEFHFFNSYNERYNPEGEPLRDLALPFPEASFDCLVCGSVFTHMYEAEMVDYVRYLKRFLQVGGKWIASFYMLPPDFAIERQPAEVLYPIVRQISEHGYIHLEEEPLKVSAFTQAFLYKFFADEGFEVVEMRPGNWLDQRNTFDMQDWFVLRRLR